MAESNNNFVVKPFAGNATNNGQFGSFDAGTPQTTNDVIFMQGLDAWLNGWLNATSGATKLPRLEEFQGIQRVFSQALININQYGIKPYLAEETYRLHAFAQDENGKLYQSLEDNNIGNLLTDTTKWNNNPFNNGDFALKNGDENETFKVADATEDNEAVNFSQTFGVGQTFQDVTSQRNITDTFVNNTNKPIIVMINIGTGNTTNIFIDGVSTFLTSNSSASGGSVVVTFIVGVGTSYKCDRFFTKWIEWR